MQLVLEDQVGRAQPIARHRRCCWKRALGFVRVGIADGREVDRAIAVARALAPNATEERVQRALPRQLRELVDRSDDKRRCQAIDFVVDRHDGNPLARCSR